MMNGMEEVMLLVRDFGTEVVLVEVGVGFVPDVESLRVVVSVGNQCYLSASTAEVRMCPIPLQLREYVAIVTCDLTPMPKEDG
jgi:hypothetical protein